VSWGKRAKGQDWDRRLERLQGEFCETLGEKRRKSITLEGNKNLENSCMREKINSVFSGNPKPPDPLLISNDFSAM
jgi:hypothetical protein